MQARSFEPASLAGGESTSIVNLLMSINTPSISVIKAVISAVEFYLYNGIFKRMYRGTDIGMNWDFDNYDIYLSNTIDYSVKPLYSRLYSVWNNQDHQTFLDGLINV